MRERIISLIASAAITVSLAPQLTAAAANKGGTQTVSYNYLFDIGTGYEQSKQHSREMEKLGRGLIAINTGGSVYLSWRLLDSEDAIYGSADSDVSFNIYRDGQLIDNVQAATNYTDNQVGTSYAVAPVKDGAEGEKCADVSVHSDSYFDIPLKKPGDETIYEGGTPSTKSFSPADCSTGDLDGDGEYEIIVKYTSAEKDVGDGGYSGTVRFGAYKLDGTKLWVNDINLGKNVYSSAHTVQFLVYDFNGDGKAEMMCQTSLGSKDAKGKYVSHSAKADSVVASTNRKIAEYSDAENESADFNGYERKIYGDEFLTVFSGETGEAIDTIDLPTPRGSAKGVDYGDDFGNRSNRFLANVAYLDGEKPYAVYMRGYYFGKNGNQRTSIAGVSFDGERLSPDYRFDTKAGQDGYYSGAEIYVGQGNHNCTVADVDNDGKDEFITGALCMEVNDNNQFRPRWCTFMEHGDALHIGDYDPTHTGFEFFTVHEDKGPNTMSGKTVEINYGMSVIDADTGEVMLHVPNTKDTGRGCMANTGSGGYYQITGVGSYQCSGGTNFTPTNNGAGSNFRIFWDGDLYDELLDGTTVTNYNGAGFDASYYGCTKINGTKSNPALQADLFGDWREELVYPTTDGNALRVFTTTTPTNYKIKTLMQDPVYRSGVAAEQTAYNQPPHVGFYMGEEVLGDVKVESIEITTSPARTVYLTGEKTLDTEGITVTASYSDGSQKELSAFSVYGFDSSAVGEKTITVSYLGKTDTFTVTVNRADRFEIVTPPEKTVYIQGERELDLEGLSVSAFSADDAEIPITDYEVSGYDLSQAGTYNVTVSYAGMEDTFEISVEPVDRIEVTRNPNTTNYAVGDEFKQDGLEVTAYSQSGASMVLSDSDYTLSGFSSAAVGEKTITVTYKGKTAQFTVSVDNVKLEFVGYPGKPNDEYSIAFKNQYSEEEFARRCVLRYVTPTETKYVYSSDGVAITGYDPSAEGRQTVTAEYNGLTATAVVEIAEIKSITAKLDTQYYAGDTFDDWQLGYILMTVTLTNGKSYNGYLGYLRYRLADGSVTLTAGENVIRMEAYVDSSVAEEGEVVLHTFDFKVNAKTADIKDLNGTYNNGYVDKRIGSYTGDFLLEYTLRLNSAAGSAEINLGGLALTIKDYGIYRSYLAENEEGGYMEWVDENIAQEPLKLNKSYTFKYYFQNAGTSDRSVKLTVLDENGNQVAHQEINPNYEWTIQSVYVNISDGANITISNAKVKDKFLITFKNGNDELQSGEVAIGEMPVYAGETPQKAEDNCYTYKFSGWSSEITPAMGDAVYTAVFNQTPKTYSIQFNLNGGTLSGDAANEYTCGIVTQLPIPSHSQEGTYFAGWFDNANFEGGEISSIGAEEYGDKVFYAKWADIPDEYRAVYNKAANSAQVMSPEAGSFDVIFASYENNILKSVSVKTLTFDKPGVITVSPKDGFLSTDDVRIYLWNSIKDMKPMQWFDKKL